MLIWYTDKININIQERSYIRDKTLTETYKNDDKRSREIWQICIKIVL